jgi:hypothetical protein
MASADKSYTVGKDIWRITVVCPKCGEVNSDTFRFCGMCGTVLEARVEPRRPAGSPVPGLPLPTALPKVANPFDSPRSSTLDDAIRPANNPTSSINSPSMLGLDQPPVNQESPNHPSVDSLRERSFSGLDSFFEPEQPKNGRRILLLVALLAALGVAGWWTYTNYLGATESHKPEAATSNTAEPPAETPSPKPATTNASAAPEAGTPPAATPAATQEGPSENANPSPDMAAKPVVKPKPAAPAPATKIVAKRETPAPSPKTAPAVPAPDIGDADFRQAEAYLYGHGGRENCDEAVKLLKSASARSNAKARSTFGTMYATGHCVPRDLPTSYLWFALALKVDPNNQILEKDLSAVWNQMTPPERQQATRMKQ